MVYETEENHKKASQKDIPPGNGNSPGQEGIAAAEDDEKKGAEKRTHSEEEVNPVAHHFPKDPCAITEQGNQRENAEKEDDDP